MFVLDIDSLNNLNNMENKGIAALREFMLESILLLSASF